MSQGPNPVTQASDLNDIVRQVTAFVSDAREAVLAPLSGEIRRIDVIRPLGDGIAADELIVLTDGTRVPFVVRYKLEESRMLIWREV